MACLALAVTPLGSAAPDWPPFLRAREAYPAQIAAWAHAKPDDFCAWLDRAFTGDRRAELLNVYDECYQGVVLNHRSRRSSPRIQ
jgi:hypothetical protein